MGFSSFAGESDLNVSKLEYSMTTANCASTT